MTDGLQKLMEQIERAIKGTEPKRNVVEPLDISAEVDGEGTKILRRTKEGKLVQEQILSRPIPEYAKRIINTYNEKKKVDETAKQLGMREIVVYKVLRNVGLVPQYKQEI